MTRQLDALVAERVMGWEHVRFSGPPWDYYGQEPDRSDTNYDVPHYSTDIAAAMHAVDAVIKRDATRLDEHPFNLCRNYAHRNTWTASFDDYQYEANADIAPMAIALMLLQYAEMPQAEIDAAMEATK